MTGSTDLPDGSVLNYYFDRAPFDPAMPDGADLVVTRGAFQFTADLRSWRPGAADVYVEFGCWGEGSQPADVMKLVGSACEHLVGDQVYVDSPGDPKTLSTKVGFTVP